MTEANLRRELKTIHQESYGWALQCCKGDRDMAMEVLQSAYLKVLEGRAIFSGKANFKTWFFAVVRNTSIDKWRSQNRFLKHFSSLEREDYVPDLSKEAQEGEPFFEEAIKALSPRQKELMHLVFYQEMSINEAASVMGLSGGTARQHYHRAKQQLQKWIVEKKIRMQ